MIRSMVLCLAACFLWFPPAPASAAAQHASSGPASAAATPAGTAPSEWRLPRQSPANAEHLAEQVTIYRDTYGVPHVHGRTDAAAVFGFMYAQAEDNLPGIERRVLASIGRLAEVEGESAYEGDLRARALEIERHARAEYENAKPEFRAVADAWAAGLNHFRRSNSPLPPSPLTDFEPWQMFSVGNWAVPFLLGGAGQVMELGELTWGPDASPRGSNVWLLGPTRSASGNALLLINPHMSTDVMAHGGNEGHLVSDEGLNLYGVNLMGSPFPELGHTPRHGWALTVNTPGIVSAWELTFDHPMDPLAYRYGDGYRTATEWTDTIRVLTDSGMRERVVTLRRSHHGPIVGEREGKPLAIRVAGHEEGGYYQQIHAMARARSLSEFQAAVGMLGIPFHNIGYADRDGNIWYVYNGRVPRRSQRFDWTRPVDGSDPETEWQGYHTLEELPQVLNPPSGWIANTNTLPFEVTGEGESPDPVDFPTYVVRDAPAAGAVARLNASRHILARPEPFTFEDFVAAAVSRRVFTADEDVPTLLAEWRRLGESDEGRAEALRPVVEALETWDRVSLLESPEMSLYTAWRFTHWAEFAGDTLALGRIRALESAVAGLERDWGTPFVPWEELSRVQRPEEGAFSDTRPSVPFAGGPGAFGMIHNMTAVPVDGERRWYGVHGNAYVAAIEFGPEVRAVTIMPFGQSADPDSPHHLDQAELFGRGGFKQASTTLEEVRANAVRAYRPGRGVFQSEGRHGAGPGWAHFGTPAPPAPHFEPRPCPFEAEPEVLEGVDCGHVTVPENWDASGGQTLEIPVAVVRATAPDPRPDALVQLSGGPSPDLHNALAVAASPLRRDRDVVLFDYRGMGFGEPVCPDVGQAYMQALRRPIPAKESLEARRRIAADCRAWAERHGVDLGAYNARSSARDVVAIVDALGYDAWHILAVSFGARVTQEILRVGAPGLRAIALFVPEPTYEEVEINGFARSLELMAGYCAREPTCAATFPDPVGAYQALYDRLEREPLPVPRASTAPGADDEVLHLTGTVLQLMVNRMVYNRTGLAGVPLLIAETARGNPAPAATVASGLALQGASITGAVWAAGCDGSGARTRAVPPEPHPALEGFWSVQTPVLCEALGVEPPSLDLRRPVESDVPALIVVGEHDPVTPPAYAAALARRLRHASVIEIPGRGHEAPPSCTTPLLLAFFDNPTRAPDGSCFQELPHVPFALPTMTEVPQ